MNRHFNSQDTEMANEHEKGCSASSTTREMQVEAKWDVPTHLSASAEVEIATMANADKKWQKLSLPPCQWEYNMVQSLWKIVWQFPKKKHRETHTYHMTHYCRRNENAPWHKILSTNASSSLVGTNRDFLQSKLWSSQPWMTFTGKNYRHTTPGWFSRELYWWKQLIPQGDILCTHNIFKATSSRKGDELVVVRSWGGT